MSSERTREIATKYSRQRFLHAFPLTPINVIGTNSQICWNIEVWAVQKRSHLVDLGESFPRNIYLQTLASIQKRTSPIKFAHLAEKSERKVRHRTFQLREIPLLRAFPHDVALPALDEAFCFGSEMVKINVRTRWYWCRTAEWRLDLRTGSFVLCLRSPWRGKGPRRLQEARYVIKSVICDPNFEGLVLRCIEAASLQPKTRRQNLDEIE